MSWWQEAIRGLFAVPTMGLSEIIGRDNQIGRTVTGGAEGGAGGFLTGGPIGAAMGAGTGMELSGTGTTDPYSLKGAGINAGSGAGAGGMTHLPALMGSGAPASPAAAGPSRVSQALQMMRGMPMGGGQQQPPQQDQQSRLAAIYQQYPQLRPHFGGQHGF